MTGGKMAGGGPHAPENGPDDGPDDGDVTPEGTSTDRVAGAVLVVAAVAVAWVSRGFVVGFPADPVGPRALPLFAAGILAAAAGVLLVRPGPDPRWPEAHTALRLGLATLILFAYPALLPVTGFILTTGAGITLLSLLFRGPVLRSGGAAFLFAGGLYLLFVYALGIPLPIGRLFLAGGG
ncbi:MAG: tripartite tricarboxylate transporter TctB family protein [Gemmatimonadales bacterium]|nr:MAG: tripartite tricarboxylate transporter TctB family protein [Gemmatimonadales bacterium]